MAKPVPPHAVVLVDVRITINAMSAQVFTALRNAVWLVELWRVEVRVDAQIGGVYEATFPNRRLEATITTIEGPRKLSFAWPLVKEDRSVVTTVAYELYPKGPQTAVHVTHHSPETVAGDWGAMWQQALDLLKSYLETPQPASEG